MIAARVLGPVELRVDGAAPPPELLWRKHLALLVYLGRSPRGARTREHLTGLLWPEKSEAAARHSLNEALRILRRVTGEAGLDTEGGQVRLSADVLELDCDLLDRYLGMSRWADACPLVAGEFMEGFAVSGCGGFEEWLATERRGWAGRSLQALVAGSEAALREGEAGRARDLAERALGLVPTSETGIAALMRALALQGDSAVALTRFEEFAARLARDVGGQPAAETRQLARRIRAGAGRAPARPQGTSGGPNARRAPLAGRARELDRLLEVWDGCRSGAASVVLIDGPSGVGKSRLAMELAERAALGGGSVALVRAVEGDGPGSGLVGLARGGLRDAPGVAGASPQALGAIAGVLPDWADRFGAAGVAPFPPLPEALAQVIEAILVESPVLLMVDDAHWADSATLQSLAAMVRDYTRLPLLVLLAADPQVPRDALDELRRRTGGDLPGAVVSLAPLDPEAIRHLAAWAMPGYDSTALERLARRVGSDSAGLPFLVVELLSAVAQGLDPHQGPASWPAPLRTLSQTLPGALPDNVVAALRIGFRRLSPVAQQALAAAAVLGDQVNAVMLGEVTGKAPEELHAALDELEWQRWLEADGRHYGFVARLARLVIERDMVTHGQRTRLLERAARSTSSLRSPTLPA